MSKTNDYSDYSSDDHDDEELSVSYINEALSYSRLGLNHAKPNIEIQLKIAGSTKGRNIISQENDNTGIFVWPGSHLMCYYLSSLGIEEKLGNVCELGCGAGLVGIAAVLSDCVSSYVFTDGDPLSMSLCEENIGLNLHTNDCEVNISTCILKFGETSCERKFEVVLAADIIYPTIRNEVIEGLFRTVDHLLKQSVEEDGEIYFILSFVSRDSFCTAIRFIEVATSANYSIHFEADEGTLFGENRNKINHPLMGAKILKLKRDSNAALVNGCLGGTNCRAFPGLKNSIQRKVEESSDSDWEAPGMSDSDYEQ